MYDHVGLFVHLIFSHESLCKKCLLCNYLWNINITPCSIVCCPQNVRVLFVWSCKKTIAIMWMMATCHFLIGLSLVVEKSNAISSSKKLVAKNSTLISKMFHSICLKLLLYWIIWTLLWSVTEFSLGTFLLVKTQNKSWPMLFLQNERRLCPHERWHVPGRPPLCRWHPTIVSEQLWLLENTT